MKGFCRDNDEKVASSKKHTEFSSECENHILFNIDNQFMTKTCKIKSISFGTAHTYKAHIRE